MLRPYFCAYHSYLENMELLNWEERGRLFTALLEYSKDGTLMYFILFPSCLFCLTLIK